MILLNNYWNIYWLTRLDYVQGIFLALSIVTGLLILAHYIVIWVGESDLKIIRGKALRIAAIISFWLFVSAACLIPNRNEAILIIAGGKALDYVGSDSSLKKVPYQTTAAISEYLDKAISEMKEDKK